MPKTKSKSKNKGTKLPYTLKSDLLFKMLFTKYPKLLKRLVAVLLNIPLASIKNFRITNAEMPPEEIGKKFCRLDIVMTVDGKKVNLEIQVENEGNYPERSMFHWAKLFVSSLPSGDDYSLLPQTISVNILGFSLFRCKAVHSEFAPMEVTRHEILSDKQRYHFFELPKLPDVESIDTTSEKDLWLALFNAETEEELQKLTATGGNIMEQAIGAYRGIAADEEFRHLHILRERAKHDEAQALRNAREKERKRMESVLKKKDAALAEKDATIEATKKEKDTAVKEKNAVIKAAKKEKEAAVKIAVETAVKAIKTETDAIIAGLRAQLAEKQ
ncbi:MAG: Rpn family recombination-promoting nuclease/putative transposase [Defluviitaleaceae bacterium]|nr:Rpn family recombination-promoting nuclease/putative transposase [Defluviitaleaceae bacterium]